MSEIFINRPIFAWVLAIVVALAGIGCAPELLEQLVRLEAPVVAHERADSLERRNEVVGDDSVRIGVDAPPGPPALPASAAAR